MVDPRVERTGGKWTDGSQSGVPVDSERILLTLLLSCRLTRARECIERLTTGVHLYKGTHS